MNNILLKFPNSRSQTAANTVPLEVRPEKGGAGEIIKSVILSTGT